MNISVAVQEAAFDVGVEIAELTSRYPEVGAVASFVGLVRGASDGSDISAMTLEHYPGMTEKALQDISATACRRWKLLAVRVIHRIGRLQPTDPIVLVAVASAHRGDAFAACEFIMDYLKTSAPFWKKEETSSGTHWVDARESDDQAMERWQRPIED